MIFSIMAPAPIPGVRDQPFFFSLDQCTYRYMVFICIDICRDVYTNI